MQKPRSLSSPTSSERFASKLFFLSFISAFIFLPIAQATPNESVKVGDKVRGKFTRKTSASASPKRGFHIYRGFITTDKKFSKIWTAKIIGNFSTTATKVHPIHTPMGDNSSKGAGSPNPSINTLSFLMAASF